MGEGVVHDLKSASRGEALARCGTKVKTPSAVITAWRADVTCVPCQETYHGASS